MLNCYEKLNTFPTHPCAVAAIIDQVVEINLQIERKWYPAIRQELATQTGLSGLKIAYKQGTLDFESDDQKEIELAYRLFDQVKHRLLTDYIKLFEHFEPRFKALFFGSKALMGDLEGHRYVALDLEKRTAIVELFPELLGQDLEVLRSRITHDFVRLRHREVAEYDFRSPAHTDVIKPGR